ncbi:MAG: hypothetical protein HP498_07580 [Nitrospira sp.]|nr:hypothetical protein [Nitrospira sp.]
MKRKFVLAAVALFSAVGLLAVESAWAAGPIEKLGLADAIVGGKPLKAEAVKTLQGRVWSQWADNPDGELCSGFNIGIQASRHPARRAGAHRQCLM